MEQTNRGEQQQLRSSALAQQQQKQQQQHQQQQQQIQDSQAQLNTKHDAIFRKIRGILNKITPEKFEKLTVDILNVGLDSTIVLKGVILLVFEKALDEPKYSSMYAQLCKRLAENAPNFDPAEKPCTFRRLLLNKCRDEFENRAQLFTQMEKRHAAAVAASGGILEIDEDFDARAVAKRKMLGNIKFIGELGKLQVVHDQILHRCCEQLLVGRRKQPISDQAEDLECLCHLMKTCGRILESPQAKFRMDQYFERLGQAAENPQMPTRIKFMIQDLVDMRRNRWMPRKIGAGSEGPRTIQQIREDAYRDGGIYLPQQSPPNSSGGHLGGKQPGQFGQGAPGQYGGAFINPLERGFFDSGSGNKGGGGGAGSDFLGAAFGFGGSSPYLGTGPGAIPAYGESVSPTPATQSREPQSAPPTANGFGKSNDRRGSEEGRRDSRSPPNYDGPRGERPKGPQQPLHRGSPTTTTGNSNNFNDSNRPPRMMNKDNRDNRDNRDRGGHFLGSDRGDDPADFGPRHLPALDFGDRYSANRTKDRERRERFNGSAAGDRAGGPPATNSRWNDDGPPGNRAFDTAPNRGPGGGMGGGMMSMSDSRLPPRFKKMALNNAQNQQQQGEQEQRGRPQPPSGGQYHQGQSPMSQPPHLQQALQGPPAHAASGRPSSYASSAGGGGGEVSLRPQGLSASANNMRLGPKTPSMLPKSAISSVESSPLGENSLLLSGHPSLPSQPAGMSKVVMMKQQEPAIILKQDKQPGRNKGGNRQKGPTREEVFARIEKILGELLQHKSTNEAAEAWKEDSWLPSKMAQTAVTHLYKQLLLKESESERALGMQFVAQLVGDGSINSTHCLEALNKVLGQLVDLERATPALRSRVAHLVAWSVAEGKIMTLGELDETLKAQTICCHPVLIEALQHMLSMPGCGSRDALKATFDAVDGLKISDHVPEDSKSDEALVALLDAAGLSFLVPLLAVRQEMARVVAGGKEGGEELAAWIEGNVKGDFLAQPGFVFGLFQVVIGHITESAKANADSGSDKAVAEAEKAALERYKTVLQPYVRDSQSLQLTAVYALQVFCHEKGFPKGLLLRNFVNFYEFDILEERAFLQWKEDVNDAYPGKGKALFQVNNWLTWLAESEDEEDED